MPVITVAMNSAKPETKAELIRRLTADAAEILGKPEESMIVFLQEHPASSIGIGGRTLEEMMKAR